MNREGMGGGSGDLLIGSSGDREHEVINTYYGDTENVYSARGRRDG